MANKPEILQISDRFEPRIRRALLSAFDAMRGRVSLAEVQRRLEARGVEGVMQLLDGIEGDLAPVREELRAAIAESGRATIGLMPKAAVLNPDFAFDLLNPNTVEFVRKYEFNLIRQVSEGTREAARNSLLRDVVSGRNPVDTARNFRSTIGLTAKQEQAVANYRKALEVLDGRALTRKLRDGRFDRTVRRAIESGQALTQKQIDKMVGRYKERYIKYRSEVIARTEALRAATVGQEESVNQMLSSNAVDNSRVRKFWVYTTDARTRAYHRQIPGMNPDGVPLDGQYQTPLGTLKFPRDPSGIALNTVQCRCTERYAFIDENGEFPGGRPRGFGPGKEPLTIESAKPRTPRGQTTKLKPTPRKRGQ